jgi:hypothetical protein
MTRQHSIEHTNFSEYTSIEELEGIKESNKAEIKELRRKMDILEQINKRLNARIFTLKNSKVIQVLSPVKPINERK